MYCSTWGEDLKVQITRITHDYLAKTFIQLYDDAAMWALSDVISDSESESDMN